MTTEHTTIHTSVPTPARTGRRVLGTFIDALTWREARTRILSWAAARQSRVVCLCNVHSVVTAWREAAFGQVLTAADLAAPDGAPIAWALRRLGIADQQRISGPDLMWQLLLDAQRMQLSVYFYGSTEATLARLHHAVNAAFPQLEITGTHAPPFRPLSPQEQQVIAHRINNSGARLVFVGLGCPKQEAWMVAQRGQINAVMLGVGAAFDFHAGVMPRAPHWMRDNGMEWLHRLASDPRRLMRRYLITNSIFIVRFLRQWLFQKKTGA